MLYLALYAWVRLVLLMTSLDAEYTARTHHTVVASLPYRTEIAEAIVMATDDIREQEVLTRIAWYESALRPDVARCSVRGDHGRSLGLFQIQPIDPRDRGRACGSVHDQVALALSYVRRSAEACPGNVGADRLAMYVSGTCRRGLPQARHRWGEEEAARGLGD